MTTLYVCRMEYVVGGENEYHILIMQLGIS